jgi:hypothetical protein
VSGAAALQVPLRVFSGMGRRFFVWGEQESKDPALLLERVCACAGFRRAVCEAHTQVHYVEVSFLALLLSRRAASAKFRGWARRASTTPVLSACSPALLVARQT